MDWAVLMRKFLFSFISPIKPTNQNLQIEIKETIRSIRELPVKIKQTSPKFFHGVMLHQVDSTIHVMLQNLVYESLHG
jgi:hypothetical protein